MFTLTPATVGTLVGVFGSPVASASAVMAEEMGGDGELARQYVVWTCALSMLTLLLWIVFLREFAFAVTEKYGEKYRDYRTSGRKSSISCEIVAPSAMRSVISQVHVLGNDGIQ